MKRSVVAFSEISLISNYQISCLLKEPATKSSCSVASFNVFWILWHEVLFISRIRTNKCQPAASVSLLDFEGADHVNLVFCLSGAITKTMAAGGIEGSVCGWRVDICLLIKNTHSDLRLKK